MKNIYFKSITNSLKFFALVTFILIGNAITAEAQVRVGFTQRTSQYTPNKKIYNVKGDFTMLGNTCLTPQNYGDNTNNNGQFMTYVDTDSDQTTFNSSSSTLVLSTENGAVPSCSNIIYAGLYWTGKSSGSNSFSATKTVVNTTTSVNTTTTFGDDQDITDTNYDLNVTRGGSTNNRYPVYTFAGNGNTYAFTFFNSGAANRVTVSVNGGAAVNVPVTVNGAGTEATLTTPYSITDGGASIKIVKLIRLAGTNESTATTESGSTAQVNITGITPFLTITKTYDKRNIKLKGPASAAYTTFTAAASDIYYPTGGTDDDIFTGYKEITDYVRTNGIGQYWAADLPLLEGNVGGTGYSGGWGIIVVYENSKMKYRDVTIFDGYAYVNSGNTSGQNLPVNGFNTVQTGNVGIKLGMMASEGDVNFTGDYFRILKNSDGTYLNLSHSNNSTTNFFNSSINAGGTRNPNLPNNTGIDIAMFNVPNANNSVIGNNQTSTNFRYGTDGDTYSIFAIAMSVDAYVPEVEGVLQATTLNGAPAVQPYTIQPNQEMGFSVDIKNLGTEAINGYKVVIPIPFNATYVPGSAVGTILSGPTPSPNTVTFDPTLGATGSIVWNYGTLILPASPSTTIARLTFKLKATTDCQILANASCGGAINVNGSQSGTGATTGITVPGTKLIQGYTQNGVCSGSPIVADISVAINGAAYVTANCQNVPIVRNFSYCNNNSSVAVSEISPNFPAGSLFYDSFPVTMASIQFTASNPFPLVAGNTATYYAVPPTGGSGCNYPFTISKCRPIIANDDTYASVSCTSAAIVGNIYSNDTLGGNPFTPGQVTFTLLTGANPNITIAANGNITVTPGIPAGVYTLTYRICEGTSLTNCDNATITITVTDTTPPVITNIPTGTTTISCPATPVFAQATATDACGSVNLTFVDVRTNGACAGSYSVTRTWTATDSAGNITTGAQTIIVTDTTAPVIAALPGVSTINCPATPVFAQATATDGCGSGANLTFNDVRTNGPCAGTYAVTRTWTATDNCGNVATASQTINVVDNTAPVIAALPAPSTISCTATPSFAVATATDACGSGATLTFNDVTTPGACAGSRTITRTWTAADACGNTSTASQVINVQDTTAPVIAALPAPSTINCPATPSFAVATATDACGSTFTLTSADVTTPGQCAGSYSVTRTWTATDACNNTSTASQTITVIDNTAPVIAQLPAPSTISCPAEPIFAVATATDACGSTFTLTSADTTTPGACAGARVVTRTWTATDACGNASTASQTITVTDTTAPVIAQLPAPSTISCPATPVFAVATATDACGSLFTLTSADVTTPGQCAGAYSVTRTWTATDTCGNTSTASQTINVTDTTAPVIAQLPAATTISCPATPVFAVATATDACGSTFTLTSADVTTPGTCAGAYAVTRTWTATDACGNVSTASQTINVQDNEGPVIAQLPAPSTISCPATPVFAQATATDACGSLFTLTSADVTTPGQCAGSYSVTRTWTATDACGNVSTAAQTINVEDTTAPVIAQLPGVSTISCPATPEFAQATATDACNSTFTLTSADVTTPGQCAGSYSVTRTWTATDSCGNVSTASQTINVQDTTAPVIDQLPAASTISCPAEPVFAVATATDACNSAFTLTSADTRTPGQCAGSYAVTRTWTATDACGNTSTASQTINVEDTTAPVIAQLPAVTTINCPAEPVFAVATATDACNSDFTLTSNDVTSPGTCAGTYSVTRTWTATDACGNVSTASQTINVQDVTAPVIAELPATSTIACPNTPVFAQATATDACGSTFTLTSADVTTPGQCAGSYSVTRTWTATDSCGNVSTASQTINVEDTVAPVIVPLPATSTIACPDTPVFAQAIAVDECGSAFTLTSNDVTTPGQCAGSYSVTRTWTATDACGNASTASQTINVEDTSAPVIAQLPQPTTISCPATPEFAQATAIDACGSEFTLTSNDVTSPGTCAGTYAVTRTWTATDTCGNISTATQTITVMDNTPPTITADAQNITVECDGTGSAGAIQAWLAINGGAVASDLCSDVTWTNNFNALGNDCSAAVTVIFTASDACGNTATTSATFTVQDVTAPTAPEAPADVTVTCGDLVPVAPQLSATDVCAGIITSVGIDTVTPGTCANSYVITRTWTFTDACANSSTATQTITVSDDIAPVIAELPAASTISCPATPEFAVATATDNCTGVVVLTSEDVTTPGQCAGSYSITRTWTAVDVCGNTTTASQTINVEDTTAPVIAELPAPSTISCPATPEFAVATATDACNSAFELTFADVTTDGQCAGSYSVTRTWTATDACGNTSTASQTINVEDTTAPVIAELPQPTTISCPAEPAFAEATATDACGSAFTLTSADTTTPGTCAGSYAVTRTWTATDACGNVSTASQTINVQDDTAPVIAELPAPTTINCPATPEFTEATATDACGSTFTLTSEDVTTQGQCAGSYSVTRTWTATDACGNVSTATQTINVQDVTAPEITAQANNITVECDGNGSQNEITAWLAINGGAIATDTCSDVTWTNNYNALGNDCSAAVTVIFTATDACGNASTTTATFTVQDVTAPTAPEAPADVTVSCAAEVPATIELSATDLCAGIITASGIDAIAQGSCPNNYVITRTWTFTDACANSSTAVQTITVNDTTAPVAPEAPAALTVSCADEVPAMVSLSATDNCSDVITVEGVDATTPGACANSYVITRTWTFTDACNNSSSVSQIITVSDTEAPVAPETPAAVTVACAAQVPAMISLTATDNCNDSITAEGVDTIAQGDCPNSYVITRTWTFTDACNNTTSTSQVITVNDEEAPVAPEAPAALTVSCADEVPAMTSLTATDNCNDAITAEGVDAIVQGACANSYVITRTWTFTDACNNTSSVSQVITVNDTEAPVAPAAPAPVTVSCAAQVPAMISLTATDDCNDAITAEGVDAIVAGECANAYVITRTWTFTDACNNTSSVSQVITVSDTEAPVISQLPATSTIGCGQTPEFAVATATDNCNGDFTLTSADTTVNGACAGSYAVTRTWTATDACGNVSTASQTINVEDTTAPVISGLPADSTIECPATPVFAEATATDACGSAVTLTFVDTNTPGNNSSYTVVRTWTATDACGNVSTATQMITVRDTQAPVAPVLADVVGQCSATVPVPTGQDACAGTITATTNAPSLTFTQQGTYTVQWTFSDGNGNSFTANQTVIVDDTTNPDIPVLADVTGQCAVTLPVPSTTDSCVGGGIVGVPDGPTTFTEVGTHVVNWTFDDGNGNVIVVPQNAIVTPNNGPTPLSSNDADCNDDEDVRWDLNAYLPTGTTGGTWTTTDAEVIQAGALVGSIFNPYQISRGNHIFTYTITNTAGCDQVFELTMFVDTKCILEPVCTDLLVHNAISVNNDGINENFVVEQIDQFNCYPTNTVEIYNRWGVLVFETRQYDNNTHVFTGRSEGRATIGAGQELPTGTYFYIIKYFDARDGVGKDRELQGYLYLTR
jgi:putative flippase GtrA